MMGAVVGLLFRLALTTREGDRMRVIDCTDSPQHGLCDPYR